MRELDKYFYLSRLMRRNMLGRHKKIKKLIFFEIFSKLAKLEPYFRNFTDIF